MPHNSHNSQNTGATVGLSNGVLSTNGNTGIGGTATTAGSSSPGEDLGSTDEVKVFKDEDEQDEAISSQDHLQEIDEEKKGLIDLTENEVCSHIIIISQIIMIIWLYLHFEKYCSMKCCYILILNFKWNFRRKVKNRYRGRSKVQFLVNILDFSFHYPLIS